MWAKKLSDPEMIDGLEREMREHGPMKMEQMRPPLLGFDPVVSGLNTIAQQLISLRMDQGNSKVKHLPIPLFPMEVAEDRIRSYAAGKRSSAIERAQSKPKWSREVSNA